MVSNLVAYSLAHLRLMGSTVAYSPVCSTVASLDSAGTQASVVPARFFHGLGEAVGNKGRGKSIARAGCPMGLTVPHTQR